MDARKGGESAPVVDPSDVVVGVPVVFPPPAPPLRNTDEVGDEDSAAVVACVTVVVLNGVVVVDAGAVAQIGVVMVFWSRVTAPDCASNLPWIVAPLSAVIDVEAITVPTRFDVVPRVAELDTCQKTLHAVELPRITTLLALAVISVDAVWKMKTAFGSPWVSRVSVPVICRVAPL